MPLSKPTDTVATPVTRAIILAAGEGSRLRPLTAERPKPMLPIGDRPLLAHTIAWLRAHGIREIAINLHHRPEAIVDYFGDGTGWDVHITYSYEARLLGTAGAVRRLADFCHGRPVAVIYGDVLTDLDLGALMAFHGEQRRRVPQLGATLSLYHVPNPTEVGLVGLATDGRITRFVEKPRPEEVFTDLANAGILIIEPSVLNYIPPDTVYDFGHDLFPQLLQHGVPLFGWVIPPDTYLLDIGSADKYARAQSEWPQRLKRR